MTTIGWIVSIAAFVVAAAIFFLLGIRYRKNVAEREISSAEEEATRIINEAIKSSENKKREALLEAKEEILKSRSEYEREVKERRADLQKQERRLQQKEENLDHKMDSIEKKEEALTAKHAAADKAAEEIKNIKHSQMEMLERISGFTAEEAKSYLLKQLEDGYALALLPEEAQQLPQWLPQAAEQELMGRARLVFRLDAAGCMPSIEMTENGGSTDEAQNFSNPSAGGVPSDAAPGDGDGRAGDGDPLKGRQADRPDI